MTWYNYCDCNHQLFLVVVIATEVSVSIVIVSELHTVDVVVGVWPGGEETLSPAP